MADRANSDGLTTAPVPEPQPTSTSTAEGVPDTRTSPRSGSTTAASSSPAGAANVAAFESLLASLRAVDTDAWLSALPASVVQTEDRSAVITRMLRGVTLPPGFDASAITGANLASDRSARRHRHRHRRLHLVQALGAGPPDRQPRRRPTGSQRDGDRKDLAHPPADVKERRLPGDSWACSPPGCTNGNWHRRDHSSAPSTPASATQRSASHSLGQEPTPEDLCL